MARLKLDVGCGPRKQSGFVGLDYKLFPGVDCIVDIAKGGLPFPDRSCDHIFSAHCLEHLSMPQSFFKEAARLLVDDGILEIWTPHAFGNEAHVFGHTFFFTEDPYLHLQLHADAYKAWHDVWWTLESITYVIRPDVLVALHRAHIDLPQALRFQRGIIDEFGVRLTVNRSGPRFCNTPRYFAIERNGERFFLESPAPATPEEIAGAIDAFRFSKA